MDQVTSAAQQYKIPLFIIDKLLLKNIQQGIYLQEIKENIKPDHYLKKYNNRIRFSKKQFNEIFYDASSSTINKDCRIFCNTNSRITHLATLADFASQETITHFSNYLKNLHQLSVITLNDIDPTLLHLNLIVYIPTHIIIVDEKIDIRKDSHVVHIAIFHERIHGNYWWQAPIKLNEHQERILHRQGLKRTEFRLPYSSGIYEKYVQFKYLFYY